MGKLYICRGLPASGKTTYARQFVAEHGFAACRINKDDLRAMTHGGVFSVEREFYITKARDAMLSQALAFGYTIINDDTNLLNHAIEPMLTIAKLYSVAVEFLMFYTDVETCIKRDAKRLSPVTAKVIRAMYDNRQPMTSEMSAYPWTIIGG